MSEWLTQLARHLEISYYVNFLGRLDSNIFQLKYTMAIEKIKILGAILELLAKQHRQFSPFGPFLR